LDPQLHCSDDATAKDPVNTGLTVPGFPVINVGSFHQLGTWHNRPSDNTPNPYYDIQDNFSILKGKHTLKFGGEYAHIEADAWVPDYGRGRIDFGGSVLSATSSGLEDFFAGAASAGRALVGNPRRRGLWKSFAGYFQDDYRMSEKLTVNLGARYELKTPIREANNLFANFDPTSPTGLVQQGTGGHSTLWKNYPNVLSPRLGFAYDVTGKGTTVVRGGFSVIYSSFSMVEWISQNQFQNSSAVTLASNPTGADLIVGGATVAPGAAGGIQVAVLNNTPSVAAWNSVVFPPPAAGKNISCSDASQCSLMGVDPNLKTPYIVNYNFGVQHSFGSNLSLEIGYVGNHGANLTGFTDVNQCAPHASGPCVRPYAKQFPFYKFINVMTNDTRSNYSGLQTTLTKRMSHGLSFIAGYTYAHALDNGSLNRFALIPQNTNNPGAEYGNSDFDVRHRMTLTSTYNIPGIKGVAQLLEGWQLNGILTLEGAQPWTVNDYGNNFSGSGDSADRWNISGNPADFNAGLNTLVYCTGPGDAGCYNQNSLTGAKLCGSVAGTSTTMPGACDMGASTTMWSTCKAAAADPGTLAKGGCIVSHSGSSVLTPNAPGTFGNIGRNIFRDSGYKNLDFSIFKNFTYKERFGAQFRLEVFNLVNRPIFANPWGASNGTSKGNNDFHQPHAFGGTSGTPDTVAGSPVVSSGSARDVQVGLKITF
jgi:hypothetical protein